MSYRASMATDLVRKVRQFAMNPASKVWPEWQGSEGRQKTRRARALAGDAPIEIFRAPPESKVTYAALMLGKLMPHQLPDKQRIAFMRGREGMSDVYRPRSVEQACWQAGRDVLEKIRGTRL